jgi:hypothetical protein
MEINETLHFRSFCFSALVYVCMPQLGVWLSDCRSVPYEFQMLNQLVEIVSKREKEMIIFNSLENLSESLYLASRFHYSKKSRIHFHISVLIYVVWDTLVSTVGIFIFNISRKHWEGYNSIYSCLIFDSFIPLMIYRVILNYCRGICLYATETPTII